MSLLFACAAGEMAGTLTLDDDGRFDRPGTYELQAGPQPYSRVAARFQGLVRGERMQLMVSVAGHTLQGPFELTRGAAPQPLAGCY